MVETTERDVANAEKLKRHDDGGKTIALAVGFASAIAAAIIGGLAASGQVTGGAFAAAMGGGCLIMLLIVSAWLSLRERSARRLRTHAAMELRREAMDRGYMRFLRWGPWVLLYFAVLVPYLTWQLQQDLPITSLEELKPQTVGYGAGIFGFFMIWIGYVVAFFGSSKRAPQDELTSAHRAKATALGFAASVPSSLALCATMIVAPQIGVLVAPGLLLFPLMLAMIRFGMLERAAARE
jgi:hypothetical protein